MFWPLGLSQYYPSFVANRIVRTNSKLTFPSQLVCGPRVPLAQELGDVQSPPGRNRSVEQCGFIQTRVDGKTPTSCLDIERAELTPQSLLRLGLHVLRPRQSRRKGNKRWCRSTLTHAGANRVSRNQDQ